MNRLHAPGPYEPTWDSLENYVVPEWYEDAKFGIFIHWGAYAVPAFGSEWYPRHMYKQGSREFEHHIATHGPQDKFGYKDFIPLFKAEKFDPAAWADLFARSGAKYVVPVAEHHDGFAMYDSGLSKWTAAKMGPCRDVVGELAEAVRARGMTFGVSSHRAEHWWFMEGGRAFPSDVSDPALSDFYGPAAPEGTQPDEAFLEDWLARCCELVDKYRPQVFWFDWWIEQPAFAPYRRRFAAYYYNRAAAWGKGVALNYKHLAFPVAAAIYDIERGQADRILPHFWQTDTATGKNSWSHVEPMDYKSSVSIIHDLVDIVSKNGCLLLNIGPRADGSIPEQDTRILEEIGGWLSLNGEAIYGTRPWHVFGEGPTQIVAGEFQDTARKPFSGEDIRYTRKGDVVYATVLGHPQEHQVLLRSLGSAMSLARGPVTGVALVATGEGLPWRQEPDGLAVSVPADVGTEAGFSLKISVKREVKE